MAPMCFLHVLFKTDERIPLLMLHQTTHVHPLSTSRRKPKELTGRARSGYKARNEPMKFTRKHRLSHTKLDVRYKHEFTKLDVRYSK